MRFNQAQAALLCGASSALIMACSNSSRPMVIEPPKIDSVSAATAAIAQYDVDGDQELSPAELQSSALSLVWDANRNGGVSRDEIRERMDKYSTARIGLINFICFVTWNGELLEGADVFFQPEAFLGGAVHAAHGTTNAAGGADLSIAEEFRPEPSFEGVQMGLYQVQITHPEITLPARYNTQTTLTFEVSPIDDIDFPTFNLDES